MTALAPLTTVFAADVETLDDTLRSAQENSARLAAAGFEASAAGSAIDLARAAGRPSLQATASGGPTRWVGSQPIGTRNVTSTAADLTARWTVYSAGRIPNQIAQAETLRRASDLHALDTRQNVLLQAGNAFVDLQTAAAAMRLSEANVVVLERQLDSVLREASNGLRTRTDTAQSQSRLARARASLRESQATLIEARARYSAAVGREPRAEAADVTVVPGRLTAADVTSEALAHNASIANLQAIVAAAAQGIDVARSGNKPELSLQAMVSNDRNSNPQFDRLTTSAVSVQLKIPLYDGGATRANVASALAQRDRREAELSDAKTSLQQQCVQAWEAYQSALARRVSVAEQIAAAKITLEGTRRELEAGTRTILDVLNAEQELLEARTSDVQAIRDANQAALSLRALMGSLSAEAP